MKPTYEELTVQLANAESKCRELAAENVELKSDRDTLARYWIEDGGDEECAMSYCEQTPATDAFLAEVRAHGVERYAEQLKSEADRAEETGWEDAAKFLRSESEKVLAFGAQLRKGAAL
ncbi:hypothetical protein I5520_01860 [Citrobacter sp. FDAARGOS_156]|uniref:hypothetical protein n=1 Tax=Citrobacter sp. FDAARGOS_156 TaxID=1702170 RepID=UPI0019034B57|nr:hypothetical protein [Citrobacter sp. FDAARGOS_156]MBJ9640743.1 hypothetical protein [Citrobacter sp. FDAARGOS_156]